MGRDHKSAPTAQALKPNQPHKRLVLPAGIEPTSSAPETDVLSIELQEQSELYAPHVSPRVNTNVELLTASFA